MSKYNPNTCQEAIDLNKVINSTNQEAQNNWQDYINWLNKTGKYFKYQNSSNLHDTDYYQVQPTAQTTQPTPQQLFNITCCQTINQSGNSAVNSNISYNGGSQSCNINGQNYGPATTLPVTTPSNIWNNYLLWLVLVLVLLVLSSSSISILFLIKKRNSH
jgi:hypothetical protein